MIAIVLAGGSSKRFGVDKVLYPLRGKPMVLYVVEKLVRSHLFEKIIVVATHRNASTLHDLGLEVLLDNLAVGPMGAIYLALRIFREILVLPCDVPLLKVSSIENMVTACLDGYDACIPRWSNGFIEPLIAVYRSSALNAFEQCIAMNDPSSRCIASRTHVLFLDVDKVFTDPNNELTNINTMEDLRKALDSIA